MRKHLRERFHTVKVRVLHPQIPKSSSVDILRGVPEGSRLSPTLFGIFAADLIHELKVQFPNATIAHNGGVRWIWGILYVDDLCLISTDARELQMMINTCQTWSEKARMQLSADKTKIMCFHIKHIILETTQARNARKRPRKVNGHNLWPASFYILSMYPDHTNPTETPHGYPIHTPTRGKAIWLSRSPTRPHGEYESCCVIHPTKFKQSPLSCPRCVLFPPLWQAPLQPYHMQLTSWNA